MAISQWMVICKSTQYFLNTPHPKFFYVNYCWGELPRILTHSWLSTWMQNPKKILAKNSLLSFSLWDLAWRSSFKWETTKMFVFAKRGCSSVEIKLKPQKIWDGGYLSQRRRIFDPMDHKNKLCELFLDCIHASFDFGLSQSWHLPPVSTTAHPCWDAIFKFLLLFVWGYRFNKSHSGCPILVYDNHNQNHDLFCRRSRVKRGCLSDLEAPPSQSLRLRVSRTDLIVSTKHF